MFGIKLLHDKFRKKQHNKASHKKGAKQSPKSEAASEQATSGQANNNDNAESTPTVEELPKETDAKYVM
ncbi:hypothetical protein M514_06359 [Trichuris suis]|uniref:Uncharacterized protein n=1 Tax=Trichuris suis TaxID=68888 RepID=A0A085NPU5_9BILA|nr:hypothetical protein M513_06359 [Trichuris suis]KFD71491.1 hypothetical protein M514_06359 [Trichuris suis]KHJ42699.1 hypothetical protein D918_07197 [Trichuris suis]